MADHALDDNDESHFVCREGRAPQHVTHVLVDKSVDEIEEDAFKDCFGLLKVETHDGIRRVGKMAFENYVSLPQINLKSVTVVCTEAFFECENLAHVEFGDELETIGSYAFHGCTSLKHLKLPSGISIGICAFVECALIDIELSERLETIRKSAFWGCDCLQRIAIQLKRDLFSFDHRLQHFNQFNRCHRLSTVDLVGWIHKTVSSLHMKRWRTDMLAEINHINHVLPGTPANNKINVIRDWMETTLNEIDYYKVKHKRYVKEGITLLELALWKAKLGEKDESYEEGKPKWTKVDTESVRKERRIACGAVMVIKHVLPFLKLL